MVRLMVNIILMGTLLGVPVLCSAASQGPYIIVIKVHHFEPAQLNVPARQKIKLIIDNQDPTAEEFESYPLNREKVVSGGKQAVIYVGPLKPGPYKYFGDFNPKTAQGVIVAQ